MNKYFETNFNLLTKELNCITTNLHLIKNKRDDSISKILNNIKSLKEDENKRINYINHRPGIYLSPYLSKTSCTFSNP